MTVDELTDEILMLCHEKLMAELFFICQPNRGDVFSFIDDHPEVLKPVIQEAIREVLFREVLPGA